jgi:hypothetical protein
MIKVLWPSSQDSTLIRHNNIIPKEFIPIPESIEHGKTQLAAGSEQQTEVRDRRSEVRSQRSEVRSQRTEDRRQNWFIRELEN